MVHYKTTNNFCPAPMRFVRYSASHIKSMRDDFNDMFDAECRKREKDGDLSVVFTLTYNDEHLCKKYGQNLLDSDDLKRLSKSSRFAKHLLRNYGYVFDMVSVGEYGNGGESHNYVGQRGVGQNPHFHCAGFFHKVRHVEGVEHCSIWQNGVCIAHGLSEVLPLLLRLAWQGCFEDSPVVYGRSMFLRSLGLGYVRLQGPIQSRRGGTYISKYIGKDIGSVFYRAYERGFCPTIFCHLLNVLDSLGFSGYECHTFIRLWSDYERYHYKDSGSSMPFELFYFFRYFDTLDVFKSEVLPICDRLSVFASLSDEFYVLFDDYYKDMNTRHSPKVRKFHGFGYSLLDDANLNDGTYTISKNGGEYTRFLPPSVYRHAYYDYSTRLVVDGYHRGDTQVCYTLNDLGRKHLRCKLENQVSKSLTLFSNYVHSAYLRPAVVFMVCLSSHWPSVDSFDENEFIDMLGNLDMALDYAVLCRQYSCYGIAEFDRRTFVNVRQWLRDNMRFVYDTLIKVESVRDDLRDKKNMKDFEFNDCWFKCFDYNY